MTATRKTFTTEFKLDAILDPYTTTFLTLIMHLLAAKPAPFGPAALTGGIARAHRCASHGKLVKNTDAQHLFL